MELSGLLDGSTYRKYSETMRENARVKLSILLWSAIAVAFIFCGIYVYNNVNPEPEAAVEGCVTVEESPFDAVARDVVASGEFNGVAIALVKPDGIVDIWGYGSLVKTENSPLCDIGNIDYALQLLQSVEQGGITLEEALLAVASSDDATSVATLDDTAHFASMMLEKGGVSGDRLLSYAAIKAMLTPAFGWNEVPYISLLSSEALEFCCSNTAIILDPTLRIAAVVVVEGGSLEQMDSFVTLRSRIASVAATTVEE